MDGSVLKSIAAKLNAFRWEVDLLACFVERVISLNRKRSVFNLLTTRREGANANTERGRGWGKSADFLMLAYTCFIIQTRWRVKRQQRKQWRDCRWPTMWNRPEWFSPYVRSAREHKRVNRTRWNRGVQEMFASSAAMG